MWMRVNDMEKIYDWLRIIIEVINWAQVLQAERKTLICYNELHQATCKYIQLQKIALKWILFWVKCLNL